MRKKIALETKEFYCVQCKSVRPYIKMLYEAHWFKGYKLTFWLCLYCGNQKTITMESKDEEKQDIYKTI